MNTKMYQFGKEITNLDLYNAEKGYGIVDAPSVEGKTDSEKSLFMGGWNLRKSAAGNNSDAYITTSDGVYITKDRYVLIFRVDVPNEGIYRVTIKVKASNGVISDMRIFAGRRNMIAHGIDIAENESYEKSFLTTVYPYIPAMTSIPNTQKAIYVSVAGQNAGISSIAVEQIYNYDLADKKDIAEFNNDNSSSNLENNAANNVRTLWIAGDSTLTDQNAGFPYYSFGSCAGWAQEMAAYFDNIAVNNQAHSGMTSNCFRDDGHWDIVYNRIKEGDIFMLQFGHNDQKRRNLAAFGGYADNLRWYVRKIREKGAFPILLSPISRIPFEDNGKMRSLLQAHADATKTVADELDVPFIDLHQITMDYWVSLGEKAHDYFMPGDITHTNEYGATYIASQIARQIRDRDIMPLSAEISGVEAAPLLPDSDTKDLPKEPAGGMFEIDIPYIDINGIPQYSDMVKALRYGLLDPCVMHLHPTEEMPRAQVLMVLFKALRISGKRPYNGKYCDLSRYEWDSSYVEACIEENLIDPATTPNDRFRPDDALTAGEFASFVIRGMEPEKDKRDISMDECLKNAIQFGIISDSYKKEDIICRADCYAGLVHMMDMAGSQKKELPKDVEIHPVG
ncbi:MAG: rhamnogalacturonan acetylesterase [Butyrivibrio sp.]|nr:rhamnogalacturonan acetylesterase [Butyrivibrio sp.]